MSLQRISAKLYIENPGEIEPNKVISVFHRWIKEASVPGLLIDVADYKHVPDGPGVMLIGHYGDYSIDMTESRPGFRYERKRDKPANLREQVQQVIGHALIGASSFSDNPAPHNPLAFATGELLINIADRLHAPNTKENFESLQHDVEAAVAEIYGAVVETVEHATDDARKPLGFRVKIEKAPDLKTLAGRVGEQASA